MSVSAKRTGGSAGTAAYAKGRASGSTTAPSQPSAALRGRGAQLLSRLDALVSLYQAKKSKLGDDRAATSWLDANLSEARQIKRSLLEALRDPKLTDSTLTALERKITVLASPQRQAIYG